MGPLFIPAVLLALFLIEEEQDERSQADLPSHEPFLRDIPMAAQSSGLMFGCREAHEMSPCHTGVELESGTAQ